MGTSSCRTLGPCFFMKRKTRSSHEALGPGTSVSPLTCVCWQMWLPVMQGLQEDTPVCPNVSSAVPSQLPLWEIKSLAHPQRCKLWQGQPEGQLLKEASLDHANIHPTSTHRRALCRQGPGNFSRWWGTCASQLRSACRELQAGSVLQCHHLGTTSLRGEEEGRQHVGTRKPAQDLNKWAQKPKPRTETKHQQQNRPS